MNVLLTSVGRRSYLVNYFKEALGGNGKVVCTNMFGHAAGMVAADIALISPPAYHPEYIPFLVDLCNTYDIRLLCSLHDLDIYVLSQDQQWLIDMDIANTLPTAEWGRITLDKYECSKLLAKEGISVPRTTLCIDSALSDLKNGELHFPLILKARTGFGSFGLTKCANENELISSFNSVAAQAVAQGLNRFIELPEDEMVLIQQAINGREVCIGILNDLNGSFCSHFACEVHSMRGGESDWVTSIDRSVHLKTAQKLSWLTRHKGIWGADLLQDGDEWKVIDLNPRFTGDYPFHHLAGANAPGAILSWCAGKKAPNHFFSHSPGITGFKDITPRIVSNPRSIVQSE